jgi:hypothetical protein
MLAAATRYALRKERWWVIPNLVGLQVGLLFDVWQAIMPSTETLSPLGLILVGAWHLIALTTLLVVLVVNARWLLEISGRGSQLARQWDLGIWLHFCFLWLVLLCFNRMVINLFALWMAMAGVRLWR